jgi:hypothetical protein
MENQEKIGKFHKFIKKMKHGLAEEDILNKNKFLEANQKYVKFLFVCKEILFYIFTLSFILFFMTFYFFENFYTLLIFCIFFSTFGCFLILYFEIKKFQKYLKIKEEDKDINLN